MRFADQSIVVTGAGSGIGRATALRFAEEGAQVVAFDLDDAVHQTAARHSAIVAVQGDASADEDIRAAVAMAVERNGGLDVICANAGILGSMAGLFEQELEEWHRIHRVNLFGSFLAVRHGAKAMLEAGRKGAIVCTASVAGLRSGAGSMVYSASKAGVINLVQTAAQELAGSGIRVNAVCPGLIETGMTRPIYEGARARGLEDRIGQLNPLKRGGEADEIASAITWLASADASYVNGHALVVDGGLSSSHPFANPQRTGTKTL